MTDKRKRFEFVIDGFTPATLPMARLAQYLLDLAAMLGEPEHVHFDRVAEGSANAVQYVDEVAVAKVRDHVKEARVVDSTSAYRRAFESLNAKLSEDGTPAELVEVSEDEERGRLIYFPGPKGHDAPEPVYGPITQQRTIQGRIINVGGSGRLANVNIQQPDKSIFYCEASRDVATELAPLLYKCDVRVIGVGKYLRESDGAWVMRSFRITHHERLNQRPPAEVIDRLRHVTRKAGLDKNILHRLAELRDDASEA